jgi:hypothetical protein
MQFRSVNLALALVLLAPGVLAGCATTPADVASFQERRAKCDHFRGEEPYNDSRARFLAEQLGNYCTGTDADLSRLKRKYARDPEVMRTLNAYDERIE